MKRFLKTAVPYAALAMLVQACGGSSSDDDDPPPGPTAPPGAFTLVSPSGAIANVTPAFTWTSSTNSTAYRIQLSLTASFQEVIWEGTGTPDWSLCRATTYHWRVIAENVLGSIVATNGPFQITTPAVAAPGAFAQAFPPDGSTGHSRAPVLSWGESAGASSYTLEIAENAGMSTNLRTFPGHRVNRSRCPFVLEPSKDYFWRVTANGTGSVVATGAPDTFRTAGTLGGAADGSLGGTGGAILRPGAGVDEAYAVAVQTDGRIVVAGRTFNGTNFDIAVLRMQHDGTLDGSFGASGKVVTPVGLGDDVAYAVAIQADGKIVVAGSTVNGAELDVAVARYTIAGVLDTTFDTDGIVTTDVDVNDGGRALAIQTDGKIVVGAQVAGAGDLSTDFALIRYLTGGGLDTGAFGTAGTTGISRTNFGPVATSNEFLYGIAIHSGTQKIAAAGWAPDPGTPTRRDFCVAQYGINGVLDVAFDGDGRVVTPIGTNVDAEAFAVAYDGTAIVAGGRVREAGNLLGDIAVARYTAAGVLDVAFDTDGLQTVSIGTEDAANAVAVDGSGRVVLAGTGSQAGGNRDMVLVRLTSAGALDGAFGPGGTAVFQFGAGDDELLSLDLAPDGRIVAAGRAFGGANVDMAVLRVLP